MVRRRERASSAGTGSNGGPWVRHGERVRHRCVSGNLRNRRSDDGEVGRGCSNERHDCNNGRAAPAGDDREEDERLLRECPEDARRRLGSGSKGLAGEERLARRKLDQDAPTMPVSTLWIGGGGAGLRCPDSPSSPEGESLPVVVPPYTPPGSFETVPRPSRRTGDHAPLSRGPFLRFNHPF